MAGRIVSPIVAACENTWNAIQRKNPDVPDAAVVVASRGRKSVYGYFGPNRWTLDAVNGEKRAHRPEVLVAAESLSRGGAEVFVTLLHEAVHGCNWTRKIKDTDASGRRHNRRFRRAAEDVGLVCEDHPLYGCLTIGLTDEAQVRWQPTIDKLDKVLTANRMSEGSKVKGPNRNYIKLMCECGRVVRISPKTADEGPVSCGLCGTDFAEE